LPILLEGGAFLDCAELHAKADTGPSTPLFLSPFSPFPAGFSAGFSQARDPVSLRGRQAEPRSLAALHFHKTLPTPSADFSGDVVLSY